MNKQEREVMGIVYECVNKITGMYPTNPANQKVKASCLDRINKASHELIRCFWAMQSSDYSDAKSYANKTLRLLKNIDAEDNENVRTRNQK